MKTNPLHFLIIMLTGLLFLPGSGRAQTPAKGATSDELFTLLAQKDSLVFDDVMNTCNMKELSSLLAPDFQFLQDEGGTKFSTIVDRAQFLESSQRFCQRNNQGAEKKVRRVVAGTLQAYTLDAYGAIQMGVQHIYVTKTGVPDQLVEVSKFTNTWRLKDGGWKLSKQFISWESIYSAHTDKLYDTIARLDDKLFGAINNRDLNTLKSMYSENLEFYHDRGGLMDYKKQMEINRQNFSDTVTKGTVRRELDKSSLQVYPIPGFGAMEIGKHHFFTKMSGQDEQLTASPYFVLIWQKKDGDWKVVRVITYGH